MPDLPDLFSPATFGALRLQNRLVMAPLTRMRASSSGAPNALMAEHYAQRASAGLIVSEGTYPSYTGHAFVQQPGLVTDEQLAGWRTVTDAVHDNGGQIVAQVMHGGRATHTDITGHEVVAPSALAVDGDAHTPQGKAPYPVPRALRDDELPGIVEEFVTGSRNAIAAGFDGVELHGANGYLLNEFLSASSNHRDGPYGGTPQNRARLVIEVVQAVCEAIGADRTGLRVSPERNAQNVMDTPEEAAATYGFLIEQLAPLGLAFLSILHPDPAGPLMQDLRGRFGGPFLVNSGFETVTTREEAIALMAAGHGDAVVVGRPFLANPDLPRRWLEGAVLNEVNWETIYVQGRTGYNDYPTLEQVG